jgi:hypothetical protein
MAGKKSPKKGDSKAKSPKKTDIAAESKFCPDEEVKKEEDYANLVNIPKHGWMKIEVKCKLFAY